MRQKSLLSIVLSVALISIVGSVAYVCTFTSVAPHAWHSFCREISWIGMPGIMFTAVLTIVFQIGVPLSAVLLIATTVNFFLYLGIGLALRKLVRTFGK